MPAGKNLADTDFGRITIHDLDRLDRDESDLLPFGVVGISPSGLVEIYNRTESDLAGLPFESVMGTHFFSDTAQCMNNYLVAQRFEDEPELDALLDFVLTLRMRPTPVRLRLLKTVDVVRRYVLIQR
ncbi:MAG: phosphonate transporter [Janthinobacterium lividum]